MKPVTIQDIAHRAKVSKSTVSRVLNGTTPVHPDKRKAVLEATRQLGFEPNFFARSLAIGRSMTIGVLTQNIGSPFYDAIAQGIIDGLDGSGYSPIFVDGQWQQEIEMRTIRALLGRRVDGLILVGGEIPSKELADLCGSVPRIVVARKLPARHHHCLSADNVDGGYRATRHLLEHGHRSIAFIGGIAHHPDAIDRLAGYKKALAEQKVKFDPQLVLDGDFTARSGERGVESLVRSQRKFTAVFAANDMTAFGARLAMYRHSISVPGDVSLVGFDDQAEAAFMTPPLTTIRQPAHEMGEQASRGLLAQIEGQPLESQQFQIELQVRESVAAPRSTGK